jgi:hypothetical protein
MKARLLESISAFGALCCCLLAGCQEFRDDQAAICSRRPTYEKWLIQQRPFLAAPPKPVFYRHEFHVNSDAKFRPNIQYYLKAGDWVGLFYFDFTIDVDEKGHPIGMRDESLVFIRLPLISTSTSDDGEKWNAYSGLQLPPERMQEIVKRVAAQDRFEEFTNRPEREYHSWMISKRASIDDWRYLKGSQHER